MIIARKDEVVEDYHGTLVADPYRWMEDPAAPDTVAWVEAQNKVTEEYLQAVPARQPLKERLTELMDYPRYSAPYKVRKGNRYIFSKNDGLQNQAVLYLQESLEGEPRLLLDPNKFSEDGTVALSGSSFNIDGTLMVYGTSKSGSDWQELKVRKIDAGEDFPEVIQWCKFSSAAWKPDSSGFYYRRLPEPGTVAEEDSSNFTKVFWHKLGTPQSEDVLIYERPEAKELSFDPFVTEDGQFLCLHVWQGTDPRSRFYYRELGSDGEFTRLLDDFDAAYNFIDNDGSLFYFETDLDAPRRRIIAIDLTNPARENWREIIGQQADVLSFVTLVNNQFVAAYMHDAHNQLKVYNLDGSSVREIELPTLGSVGELSGRREDSEMFVGFTSFLYPTSIFRYDFATGQMTPFRESELKFDPSGFETKQVFYPSKDGTRIPLFLVHKRGLRLNGDNPTLLYGYGGFNISLTPSFAVSRLVWLENGGIFALANLRGGGEYGEEWHQAGILHNKQNVFDDFVAAGEWLIANSYTSSKKLAIQGGSNGGLLVAACMVQRPDLWGAVMCQVPVADMLRYHKFTVGRYWVSDYGNAEADPAHFKFLYAYSPVHNVKEGVAYPPTIIATADTDDRVVPAHAKKFAAALQAAHSGDNPLLVRIETKAGHGAGKPTAKVIEEQADLYAFLFKTFSMSAS